MRRRMAAALTVICMSFVLALLFARLRSTPPQSEIWIGRRNDDLAGRGTRVDPKNGNTAEKLAEAISSVPENTTAHILPGRYSLISCRLKKGQRISGAGKDLTTLEWNGAGNPGNALLLIPAHADGVSVSDLTFDSRGDLHAITPPAIQSSNANHVTFRRLRSTRVSNDGSVPGIPEWFIMAQFSGSHPSENYDGLIEDCEVDHFRPQGGGYATCIFTELRNTLVRHNYVHDCPRAIAFGVGYENTVTENTSDHCGCGANHDTWIAHRSRITKNRFLHCAQYGILLLCDGFSVSSSNAADQWIIANNYITITGERPDVTGIQVREPFVTNTQVIENTVLCDIPVQGQKMMAFWIDAGGTTRFHKNRCSDGFIARVATSSGMVDARDNRYVSGGPIRNVAGTSLVRNDGGRRGSLGGLLALGW
jgi:hypothetical protein